MKDDDKFEIKRALDLLPHVTGASWAMTWFRLNKIKNPSKEEFRTKTIEYLKKIQPLLDSFEDNENFKEISQYVKSRMKSEIELIRDGENKEIEKRHQRYLDYG